MSVNKFMHTRNIYRIPPNFKELAELFEEFRAVSKPDITGKISIDFKDPESLRILTKCLLKKDFKVDISIPCDRLVPTLPLRLNYILWIEDLMKATQKNNNIIGLDIGTGACAIYPVLGAVKNKWKMIGTENDTQSLKQAQDNICKNQLQNLITVKYNTTDTIIDHLFVEDDMLEFDFCMCNPPFYSNVQELYESRSTARPPPKNAFTGSPQELITKGGELEFIRNLICESNNHKKKISIFTTMVGHKYNLNELLEDLKEKEVKFTHTEFCQGRVTRWGLAWTFEEFDLYNLKPPREKLVKKTTPMTFILPALNKQNDASDTQTPAYVKIKELLKELKINYNTINKRNNVTSLKIRASKNTWSSQRQKRRMMKRQEETIKKQKIEHNPTVTNLDNTNTNYNMTDEEKQNSDEIKLPVGDTHKYDDSYNKDNAQDNSKKPTIENPENNQYETGYEDHTMPQRNKINSNKSGHDSSGSSDKAAGIIAEGVMKLIEGENEIKIIMEFLDGTGGKEALHQIFQYIKNNWK